VKAVSVEAYTLAERIEFYQKKKNIFGDKFDPETGLKLEPENAYVLFYELMYPKNLISNYVEEFNKMQGF